MITGYVTAGQPAWVSVGVTDSSASIAGAYAHHNISGIPRDVNLVAVPGDYLTALHTSVSFDSSYANATLTVDAAAVRNPSTGWRRRPTRRSASRTSR